MKKNIFTAITYCGLIFIGLVFWSCNKEANEQNKEYIKYGTSFNNCVGYCIHEIEITKELIKFKKYGWADSIVTKECNKIYSEEEWNNLVSKISLTDFKKLDETIGCPDCADGGAEWIEINIENTNRKVTFEYLNEPEQFKPYIDSLRFRYAGFEGCQ